MLTGYVMYSFVSDSLFEANLKNELLSISVWSSTSAEGSALLPYSVCKHRSNGAILGEDGAILLYPSSFLSE